MSKSSIYENNWTNIVFENKNKEYGAYQLRQEYSKTSITALFAGLLLITGLGSASMLISKLKMDTTVDSGPTVIPDYVVKPFEYKPIVKPKDPEPIVPAQQSTAKPAVDLSQLSHPIIVSPDEAVDNIAKNTQNAPAVDNNSGGGGNGINTIPGGGGGGEGPAIVAPVINDPVVPAILDKMPEFPGGIKSFYTFVGKNFTRPELDEDRVLRVYVSFVIERDGSMTDIVVKNDPGYGLGKEAVRVLKSLKTKWTPGILNGQPVRTAYNLPITIQTQAE
ncbi:energy transducer TonB [Flavobacterium gelatinilyticum]|uniref:energy transducer TonB n=1 Tax=Flavobacterium gelatinilyticum TaxID=3003260 RepID=UPI00248150FA|nr:energy transducer TonB [Flavobacterium gelatinilyticum]